MSHPHRYTTAPTTWTNPHDSSIKRNISTKRESEIATDIGLPVSFPFVLPSGEVGEEKLEKEEERRGTEGRGELRILRRLSTFPFLLIRPPLAPCPNYPELTLSSG